MAEKDSENEENEIKKTPPLEWLVAAIGFVLVTAMVGYLIYSAAAKIDSPPKLTVAEDYTITKIGDEYLVKFTLANDGEENAAEVTVEGQVDAGDKEPESSAVTIDYAPAHSKREGGLIFTKEPIKGENFTIRAVGYKKP